MIPHLEKYGVFDDVALDDVSNRTFELHIAGPGAQVALKEAGARHYRPSRRIYATRGHRACRAGPCEVIRVVAPSGSPA